MFDALRYPVQTPGWICLLIFAIGGSIVLLLSGVFPSGFELIAMALLTLFGFFVMGQLQCFGAFLLQAAARGHPSPPPPPTDALNPFGGVVVPIVLGLVWSSAASVRAAFGSQNAFAWFSAAVMALIVPALVAIMVITDSAVEGLDPRRVLLFVRRLGAVYAGLCLTLWIGYGGIFAAIWYCDTGAPIALLAAGYVFLLMAHVAGLLLFERRAQLELDTQHSPEQDVAADLAHDEAELKALFFELHRLCGVDRYREAYARLDVHLRKDRYRNDARAHEMLQQFQGRPLALEHACHYIERLLAARKPLQAWDVCKRCLDEDGLFRPLSEHSLITLVGQSGHVDARYAELLLADFARAYPDSALAANAMFRLAQIRIEHLDDRESGAALLRTLREEHTQFARLPKFVDYVERFGDLEG
jgi:hypothetical protein